MDKSETYEEKQIKQLGERIKMYRKQAGYSSSEKFAYEKGFNRSQYGKYEVGVNMRFDSLLKVLQALEITPAEFFSEGFELEDDEG
ncbi:MAG: helix-turn-helix transcriptional regulator [Bacteroidota bacterium]